MNNLTKSDKSKTQLITTINFISSIDIKIMIDDEADEVIKKTFDSIKDRYQNNLDSVKGSELPLIMFIYYSTNVIKKIRIVVDQIWILLTE